MLWKLNPYNPSIRYFHSHNLGIAPLAGHIIPFYALLKDNPGVLSNYLSIFANSGANILTINQTIPTNGCAGVTISAETGDMSEELDDLMTRAAAAEGVLKFEIIAG